VRRRRKTFSSKNRTTCFFFRINVNRTDGRGLSSLTNHLCQILRFIFIIWVNSLLNLSEREPTPASEMLNEALIGLPSQGSSPRSIES